MRPTSRLNQHLRLVDTGAMMTTLKLIEGWGAWLTVAGAAPATILTRTRCLRRAARQLGGLANVTHNDLLAWLTQYPNPNTRSTMLSYLRCFYVWAVGEGLLSNNPTERMPKIKVPRGLPRPLPMRDFEALIAVAPPRERLWALLMAYGGLRACEVAAVRPEHLSQTPSGRWWLWIPRAKGGAEQRVPLPSWLAGELLTGPRWEISPQSVSRSLSKLLRSIGSTGTGHMLRHWCLTEALRNCGNLRLVQELARHQNPQTTARYTGVDEDDIANLVEALPRVA